MASSSSNASTALNGLATLRVDTQDPSYRATAAHAPDKESTWTHPIESDGWVLAHNAIRAEIDKFEVVLSHLGDRQLKDWEKHALKEWWAGHFEHVHSHHSNEDTIMNPVIRQRVNYPDKLEADHEVLVAHMDKITALFNAGAWKAVLDQTREDGAATAAPVLRAWRRYKAVMFPHLHEEEQVSLPLLRAYFTPAEVAPVIHKILAKESKANLGSFIHHIPGGKRGVMAFMKQEGIPSFVWYLQFKGARAAYRGERESMLEALLRGDAAWTTRGRTHKVELPHAMHISPMPIDLDPPMSPPSSPCAVRA